MKKRLYQTKKVNTVPLGGGGCRIPAKASGYFSSMKKRLYQTKNVNTVQILRWLLAFSWKWSSSSFIKAVVSKKIAA